ncbi:uroporphyrinogen-III synthase [Rivularia sp. UHCC 0363]|uniref:uroporphyrinogen-III synthase n=1 Tax=Rivularia sp. UHCC 0363 TaxID=3110244 RepID=UPI002B211B98|nr:uroporphyrinogen-III synthase [Rivularia sp. UHCC 0363]MEA5594122.1 uroporphyrinogen-III synthase [Rivularia sp. UHCC 0363]
MTANTSSQISATISPTLPLSGKTVLITRSVGQSSQFARLIADAGANAIEMAALEICPPSSWDALDNAIANLAEFDWLIFTSSNGISYFFERLMLLGKDARTLANLKIAVVGEKTAKILENHNLKPDFIPPNFIADSLIEHFPEQLAGQKILFPRVETGGRENLVEEFQNQGAEITEVAAYQSCCPDSIPPSAELALQSGTVDVIAFASSKTVKFFTQLAQKVFSDNSQDNQSSVVSSYLEEVCIASIGPQTSIACQTYFGRVDVEASEYTLDGLTQAIIDWATNLR